MKKILTSLAVVFCAAILSAYNPPAGGQNLFNISSPTQLTSASSAAGGGIFMPGPDSIAFNPVLPAFEQRVQLDTDFTFLANTGHGDNGAAFQTGILIPLKMFNVSGLLNGVFLEAEDSYLANTLNFKAGLSKEVTERISVGFDIAAGVLWGADVGEDTDESDWALGADVGVLYRLEQLAFMNDFRVGVSVLNLGKYYTAGVIPIDEDSKADLFPALATLRTGVAANLFTTKEFTGGFSFDVALPSFQNVVFDAGLMFGIKDTVFLSIAESIDVKEASNGSANFLPAIGLSVKFNLNAKNNSYLSAHSWENSEMLASAAWQQRYETIQAVSAGLRIKLGTQDVEPPVIRIWDEN